MFDNKEIVGAIINRFAQERDTLLDKNKYFIEASAHIEKMMEYDLIDQDELHNYIYKAISESSETSYFQGLQDGAGLLHSLVSGKCAKEVMQTWGSPIDDKHLIEININSHYSNKKKGVSYDG